MLNSSGMLIPQSSGLSATLTTANSSIYLKIRDEKDYFADAKYLDHQRTGLRGGYEETLLVFGQIVETRE